MKKNKWEAFSESQSCCLVFVVPPMASDEVSPKAEFCFLPICISTFRVAFSTPFDFGPHLLVTLARTNGNRPQLKGVCTQARVSISKTS